MDTARFELVLRVSNVNNVTVANVLLEPRNSVDPEDAAGSRSRNGSSIMMGPGTSDNRTDDLAAAVFIATIAFLALLLWLCHWRLRQSAASQGWSRNKAEDTLMKRFDLPPSYKDIVFRSTPPEYQESVMQKINPEVNPKWALELESETLEADIRRTILKKVHSHDPGSSQGATAMDPLTAGHN